MSCRCVTCIYRATDQSEAKARPGCAYIQHTGKSRLAEVYRRLGVDHITDEVREAMRPENCWHYQRGGKLELDERSILLAGSTPMGKGAPAQTRAVTSGPPRASAPTKAAKEPKPKVPKPPKPPKPQKERVRPAWEDKARELYDAGLSDGEIGRRLGISVSNVLRWRQREGLPSRRRESQTGAYLQLYREGLSDGEIAAATGRSKKSVQRWRNNEGLPFNPDKQKRESDAVMLRRKELYEQGLSDAEIAAATGKEERAVRNWRNRRRLPPNRKPAKPVEWEEEALRLLREGKTDKEIAQAVGRKRNTIYCWRTRRGLERNPAPRGRKKDAAV